MLKNIRNRMKLQREMALRRCETVWRLVYLERLTLTDAWIQAFPSTRAKRKNWPILAHRACERFEQENASAVNEMGESYGLGLDRVLKEIQKGLTQKRPLVYQGKIMKDEKGRPIEIDDNVTQQKMREALIRIHGLEKRIAVHTGRGGGPIPVGVMIMPAKRPKGKQSGDAGLR